MTQHTNKTIKKGSLRILRLPKTPLHGHGDYKILLPGLGTPAINIFLQVPSVARPWKDHKR